MDLSDAVRRQAAAFAGRLAAGVLVTLLGQHGSGKSALLSVVLGEKPPPLRMSAAGLLVAAAPDVPVMATAPGHVVHWTCAAPLPPAARFLDVQGSADPSVHAARQKWALSVSDVVLWCGTGFDSEDAGIWSIAPDQLKDNSFLVLTKADAVAGLGDLQRRLSGMQAVAAQEFHSVFPTTTAQATQAIHAGVALRDEVLSASGVSSLIAAVMRLVQSGQEADLDGALLFLQRHGIPDLGAQQTAKASDTVTGNGFAEVLSLCRTRAQTMAAALEGPGDRWPEVLRTHCEDFATALAEIAQAQDGAATAWHDCLLDASDKITLLSMENDESALDEALTMILQLSREAEQRMFR